MANLDTHLNTNPELGRARLRRWLNDGLIKIDETEEPKRKEPGGFRPPG